MSPEAPTETFRAAPLRIGKYEFFPPVLPAPMCGISDRPWRNLSRENGCPMVFTQMISSEAVVRGGEKGWRLLDMDPAESPICAQLFGADPEALAETARRLVEAGATIVDLNMGCPVNKVTNNNAGAALMRQPELVARIFDAIRAAITVPFTVKFRAGWEKYGEEAFAIARLAEAHGLDAVCIHARTREQKFKGNADWSIIKAVKEIIKLPVIGNGDVKSADDAVRLLRDFHADAVMVGRAAMGNPWLFAEISARLRGDPAPAKPTVFERIDTMARHAQMMYDRKGHHGLIEMRKHAVCYLKGFRDARALKSRLLSIVDIDEYMRALEEGKAVVEAAENEVWGLDASEAAAPDSPCSPDSP